MIGQRVTFRPQSSPPAPRHTSEQLDSRCPDGFNTRQLRLRIIAQIAQSVEQGIENPRVGSSILSLGTNTLFCPLRTHYLKGFYSLLLGFCVAMCHTIVPHTFRWLGEVRGRGACAIFVLSG